MTLLSWLGFAAGALTAASQAPQALKAWRTGATADLSVRTLAALATGLGLWIAYGIGMGDAPLIVANGVSLALTGAVLAAKLRFG